jgi:hypothetical protein
MKRHRLRLVFLFLIVLILPTLAIVVQGRRIAAQERELARTRADEQRQETELRMAAQLGRDLFARLERIKLEEMANSPAGVPLEQRVRRFTATSASSR